MSGLQAVARGAGVPERLRLRSGRGPIPWPLLLIPTATALALGLALKLPGSYVALGVAIGIIVALFVAFSLSVEQGLVVLAIYLGAVDGVVKLGTGSQVA